MKYTIDTAMCEKYNLKFSSLLAILFLNTKENFDECVKELLDKEIIVKQTNIFGNEYFITERWNTIIENILIDSQDTTPDDIDERLDNLARKMRDIFPAGKKNGTNKYWKSNIRDTKDKLKRFFDRYGYQYTDEEILNATQKYVDSFNNDTQLMRVLEHFIIKNELKKDEDGKQHIETISELASELDNEGYNVLDYDWSTENI